MKRFLIMLLAGITLCMSACQPTPENPVVISKNDGKLEESIYGTPAPLGKYSAPETWTEEMNGPEELVKVRINANIAVPDVEAYPVYRVTPSVIDDEAVNNFIGACFGDEKLYHVINSRTKDVILKEILKKQSQFDDPESLLNKQLRSGEATQEDYDHEKKNADAQIAELQKEYNQAPDEPIMEDFDSTKFVLFTTNAMSGDNKLLELKGSSKDLTKHIYIAKDLDAKGSFGEARRQKKYYKARKGNTLLFNIRSTDIYKSDEDIDELNLSRNEALNVAKDFITNNLKYENWGLVTSCHEYYLPAEYDFVTWYADLKKTNEERPRRYAFVFTQKIDDIPVLFYTYSDQNYHDVEPFWDQQVLCIRVDDDGVFSVDEISSLKTTDKLNDNAKLLSFDKIQDIFRQQIKYNLNYNKEHKEDEQEGWDGSDEPYEIEIGINDIRLGYIKIREKDNTSGTQGILVPVWMFYGRQTNKYHSQSDTYWQLDKDNNRIIQEDFMCPFLCINAIDGSIIDLSKGY